MATAPKKSPAKKASRKAAKKASEPAGCLAGASLTPVTPKIGETRGNLQARAAAFNRRRGKPG